MTDDIQPGSANYRFDGATRCSVRMHPVSRDEILMGFSLMQGPTVDGRNAAAMFFARLHAQEQGVLGIGIPIDIPSSLECRLPRATQINIYKCEMRKNVAGARFAYVAAAFFGPLPSRPPILCLVQCGYTDDPYHFSALEGYVALAIEAHSILFPDAGGSHDS